ncbi:radical SAM protein [Candidatus Sumerlaeota bacterium]|nr:radical SAM protein [Candidatus Sumerlaeota bacterium]
MTDQCHPPFFPECMRVAPALSNPVFPRAPKPRSVLLINPFYPKSPYNSFGKHVLTPAHSLLSLASVTPDNWEARFWDENLLQGAPPVNPLPSVVGITVMITCASRARELSAYYRNLGAKVILGGSHVQSCPDEMTDCCDALVLGNGVRVWREILEDCEKSVLKKRYIGSYREPFREEPAPRRDIISQCDFLTTASLIATRGCHNRCRFCILSTKGLIMPRQVRDAQIVVEEFLSTGEPYGVFIDNNLGSDRKYLRDLCRALKSIGKIWSAAVSIDITDDPELVRAMAEAGCTGVFVGFESIRGANLKEADKKSPHPLDYSRRIRIFHRFGVQVNGSFVFGFDHDDKSVFERTVRWIEKNRLECATYHILTPYPGTPLFDKFDSEGRLLHQNWDLYDSAHAVFRPLLMTTEELEEGYQWSYERTFSLSSIWARRPERISELPGYLAMSLLYKHTNFLWPFVIRRRLTHLVWRPLVELARRRHLRYRKTLSGNEKKIKTTPVMVPPGV